MAVSCVLTTLQANATCFMYPCTAQPERDAINIYTAVQELQAAGGTDYRTDSNALYVAAKAWGSMSPEQQAGVAAYINVVNATTAGASFTTTIDALKLGSKCFVCLPSEQRRAILLFLKCSLNAVAKPSP